MASIFTYDPDPPRVASPWLTPTDSPKPSTPQNGTTFPPDSTVMTGQLADYGVTRLEAEPQEGPTEYKLHLLLRPRRNYSSSSTGSSISGSQHTQRRKPAFPVENEPGPVLAPSNQSRQTRLEQLTTQLLWRLQQSSPYHASSTGDLVLPKLPEATESLTTPTRPGKLLAGLEESRGALYEIGVSDDGTFVGLTEDELNESLTNLRAMAASLGCNVEVVRKVLVGKCEWLELVKNNPSTNYSANQESKSGDQEALRYQAALWVAEALVTPDLSSRGNAKATIGRVSSLNDEELPGVRDDMFMNDTLLSHTNVEQLRVTLTGPTTSGKSSLLGTLSTATLDNGRGKSRLSLLKHRHEIESGVTSSVTQELIGYKDKDIINYAAGNVNSWTDIHASAQHGRLVFVSDTGGHPRYRKNTVRGLVGWAPHWTALCIAADDGDSVPSGAGGTSTAQDILGSAGVGIDLAKAHLELCLKFEKPLVIVITKLDIASKSNIRHILSKILTAVKRTGRIPLIVKPESTDTSIHESDLSTIREGDLVATRSVVDQIITSGDLVSVVPIILTSSSKGTGIRSMHALLRSLPVPQTPTASDFTGLALNPEQPSCLFHVEDVFEGLQASYDPLGLSNRQGDTGSVIAGYMRFGQLSIGDTVVLGPFPSVETDEHDSSPRGATRFSPASFSKSAVRSSSNLDMSQAPRSLLTASISKSEWLNAKVVSIRNLRLPVHTLEAGEVGTIGFVLDVSHATNESIERSAASVHRIRKGMVMAIPSRHMLESGHTLQAASGFTASFKDEDINSLAVGSSVVVYIASIRASARIVRHSRSTSHDPNAVQMADNLDDDVFGLSADLESDNGSIGHNLSDANGITSVILELVTTREWIELGSQVLIMPVGGHGLYYGSERGEKGIAGLEGFVGNVVEVVD